MFRLQGSKTCYSKISLWHEEYFKLKIIKAHKTQEESLIFHLTAKKNEDRRLGPRTELSFLQRIWSSCSRGNSRQGLKIRVLSMSHCTSARPSKYLFTKLLLFNLKQIAFLPFEVPNHNTQHPLLSLAEDDV